MEMVSEREGHLSQSCSQGGCGDRHRGRHLAHALRRFVFVESRAWDVPSGA